MLFNTQIFLLLFLPLSVLVFHALKERKHQLLWLTVVSFVFYGYWSPIYVPLLVCSILGNALCAHLYSKSRQKRVIYAGVAFNLLLIGYFKYYDFAIGNMNEAFGVEWTLVNVALPLGISFFTFQQISYLLDLGRTKSLKPYPLKKYVVYVALFPQLIAGPIVRHNELVPQFARKRGKAKTYEMLGLGLTIFIIGLLKKVMVADKMAEYASPILDSGYAGEAVHTLIAWIALAAYSLQIYFDFSGYSDMAIGACMMFGFIIPVNFINPYRATSLKEFWRRWHVTLSRWIRDYLYIPMGGSRAGLSRQLLAVFVTFFLCGVWHGAGWNFILWGVMHGVALILGVLWSKTSIRIPTVFSWALTVLFVCLAWVMFRAPDASSALLYYQQLFDVAGLWEKVSIPRDMSLYIIAMGLVCLFAPTSQDIIAKYVKSWHWLAVLLAVIYVYMGVYLGEENYSEFIYFQF